MCEALRELFKDELEEGITKARLEGMNEGISQGLSQGVSQGLNQGIQSMIEACKSLGASKDVVFNLVMEKFDLPNDEAENYMELYW